MDVATRIVRLHHGPILFSGKLSSRGRSVTGISAPERAASRGRIRDRLLRGRRGGLHSSRGSRQTGF